MDAIIGQCKARAGYAIFKAAIESGALTKQKASAANLVGAIRVAEKLERGMVVTILPDNADKYKDITKKLL